MFLTSCKLSDKPIPQAINRVMLLPNIFMQGIAVNVYKHTNSIEASINEFLRIIPCLLRPFKIPNMVVEVKKTGAASEATRIYCPKSSLP